MTFYLKHRALSLAELDQEGVRETLTKILSSGNFPHAFLFSGPKGTGKTSAARILAKIVNCENVELGKGKSIEPCNKCKQCKSISGESNLDVIEIDAASHRGIEDVRVLREAVKLSPAYAKKKVYIIDEAHMLTPEASNALLKTLEEPPSHVVFILATTNPEKLIGTIKSRTVNIPFKKATAEEITRSLSRIAKREKIEVEKGVYDLISQKSEGSFRDAIKIFEQVSLGGGKVTGEKVEKELLEGESQALKAFFEYLIKKDAKKALTQISEMAEKGVAPSDLARDIVKALRQSVLAKTGLGEDPFTDLAKEDAVELAKLFSKASAEIAQSPIEELPLELAVVEWCGEEAEEEEEEEKESQEKEKLSLKKDLTEAVGEQLKGLPEVDEDLWRKILSEVRPINSSIEALLRAAKPLGFDGRTLILGVFYKFHKERLEEVKHRMILEGVVAKLLNTPVKINCTLTEPPPRKVIEAIKEDVVLTESEALTAESDKDIIKAAKEIFGN